MPASTSRTSSRMDCGVAPRSSARCDASWITGPSITGSENGIPTSTASAPASATARTTSTHSWSMPPVTYGTRILRPWSRAARNRFSSSANLAAQDVADLLHVLVATTAQVDEHRLPGERVAILRHPRERMRRLERRDDALGARQQHERVEDLLVGDRHVAGPAEVGQVRVLGADARIIEP